MTEYSAFDDPAEDLFDDAEELSISSADEPRRRPGRPRKGGVQTILPLRGVVDSPSHECLVLEATPPEPQPFKTITALMSKLFIDVNMVFTPDMMYLIGSNNNNLHCLAASAGTSFCQYFCRRQVSVSSPSDQVSEALTFINSQTSNITLQMSSEETSGSRDINILVETGADSRGAHPVNTNAPTVDINSVGAYVTKERVETPCFRFVIKSQKLKAIAQGITKVKSTASRITCDGTTVKFEYSTSTGKQNHETFDSSAINLESNLGSQYFSCSIDMSSLCKITSLTKEYICISGDSTRIGDSVARIICSANVSSFAVFFVFSQNSKIQTPMIMNDSCPTPAPLSTINALYGGQSVPPVPTEHGATQFMGGIPSDQ